MLASALFYQLTCSDGNFSTAIDSRVIGPGSLSQMPLSLASECFVGSGHLWEGLFTSTAATTERGSWDRGISDVNEA